VSRELTTHEEWQRHVRGVIRIAPIVLLLAIVMFAFSVQRLPRSPGFWLGSAAIGAGWFPLLWRYWRGPSPRFFGLLISAFVLPGLILSDRFLGASRHLSFWAAAQYVSVAISVVMTLLLVFQRRVRESLSADRRDV